MIQRLTDMAHRLTETAYKPMNGNDFKDDFGEVSLVPLSESAAGNLPPGVLAVVRGPFFFPEGVSRNKRFYPRELWETVLGNTSVQEKLNNRTMFGTVYHPEREPDIEQLSHIVTRLWVDPSNPKVGLGEAWIMDTPRGQVLNTLIRAGSKWCVSSRATGTFQSNKYHESGVPVVDPKTYSFQTFDFTPDPGFIDAHPKLVESLLSDTKSGNQPMMEVHSMTQYNTRQMSEEALQSLINDKKRIEQSLDEALGQIQTYQHLGTPEIIQQALDQAVVDRNLVTAYEEVGTVDDIYTLNNRVAQLEDSLAEYGELGTPERIKDVFEATEKLSETLADYTKIGTVNDIKRVYERSSKMMEVLREYKDLGTPNKIGEAFDKAEAALEELKSYRTEFGSIDEIQESYDYVERLIEEYKRYKPLGTPEMIQETYDRILDFVKVHKMSELNHKVPDLAAEYNLPESDVRTIVDVVGVEEQKIRAALSRLSESHRNRTNQFALKNEPLRESRPAQVSRTLIEAIGDNC
jgi:hypothetical protein